MENKEIIEKKFNELNDLMLDPNMDRIFNLANYAINAYLHPNNQKETNILNAAIINATVIDIKYPEYHVFDDGELTENLTLNLTLEEYYNTYNSLLTSFCHKVLAFALSIQNNCPNNNKYYEELLLAKNALLAFDYNNMLSGLLNPKLESIFQKDLTLMKEIVKYLDSGKINVATILISLKDYRKLYPDNKVSVFESLQRLTGNMQNIRK